MIPTIEARAYVTAEEHARLHEKAVKEEMTRKDYNGRLLAWGLNNAPPEAILRLNGQPSNPAIPQAKRTTPLLFIETWARVVKAGGAIEDVMEVTGQTLPACRQLAADYRKNRNIPLDPLPSNGSARTKATDRGNALLLARFNEILKSEDD